MYLDCLVKMPNVPGKIVCQKKAETTYVYYVFIMKRVAPMTLKRNIRPRKE